jgi:hypothetical protein
MSEPSPPSAFLSNQSKKNLIPKMKSESLYFDNNNDRDDVYGLKQLFIKKKERNRPSPKDPQIFSGIRTRETSSKHIFKSLRSKRVNNHMAHNNKQENLKS